MESRPIPRFVLDDARAELPWMMERLEMIDRVMDHVRREGLPRKIRRNRIGKLRALRHSIESDIEYATRATERLEHASSWADLEDRSENPNRPTAASEPAITEHPDRAAG